MWSSKSDLAFCYILGDGVPVNLQKAIDLFVEADRASTGMDNTDYLADFILCQLVDMRILSALPIDVFEHVMSNPERRKLFTVITTMLKLPGCGSIVWNYRKLFGKT